MYISEAEFSSKFNDYLIKKLGYTQSSYKDSIEIDKIDLNNWSDGIITFSKTGNNSRCISKTENLSNLKVEFENLNNINNFTKINNLPI